MGGKRVRCPYHEDRHPSGYLTDDGWFTCYSVRCALHGRWVRVSDPDRFEAFERPRGSRRSFPTPSARFYESARRVLAGNADALAYLRERGVLRAAMETGCGAFNDFIVVPFGDAGYVLARWRGRAPWRASYLTVGRPEPRILRAETRDLYLAFGVFDALSLLEYGLSVVLWPFGATPRPFRPDPPARVWIVPDARPPEERDAAWMLARRIGPLASVLEIDYPRGMKDPNDLHRAGILWQKISGGVR